MAKTSYDQAKSDMSHLGVLIVVYFIAAITILPIAKWLFVLCKIDDNKRAEFIKNTFVNIWTYVYITWALVICSFVYAAYHN
jgi:TRAP-type C4-dicarboxylate transport system permease large subunit